MLKSNTSVVGEKTSKTSGSKAQSKLKKAAKTDPETKESNLGIRLYELTVVVAPTVASENRGSIIDSLRSILKQAGGTVNTVEEWGLRDLAYPIEKARNGWYATVNVSLPGSQVKRIESEMMRDRNILRHLLIKHQ